MFAGGHGNPGDIIIQAGAHQWGDEATVDFEADCEHAGQRSTKCTVCGGVKPESEEVIQAIGHSWKAAEYDPPVWTEADGGYTVKATFVCEHDASHKATVELPATIESDTSHEYAVTFTKDPDGNDLAEPLTYTKAADEPNPGVIEVAAPTGKTLTYNGKTQTGVAAGSHYTLSGTTQATKAGAYTAEATLETSIEHTYKWSDGTTEPKTIKWTISKAANPLKIAAKKAKVKYSKLKKKAKRLKVAKVIKFTKAGQGTLTFAKAKGSKKISIDKKTGKVTVKKGLKKGTYKVTVKVQTAGNANFKASAVQAVTFKVKVK